MDQKDHIHTEDSHEKNHSHNDTGEHHEKIEKNEDHTSTHGSIALNAWEIVTNFPSLKKLNFFPSLIAMLWLLVIIIYQVTFTYVIIFHKKDVFMESVLQMVHTEYF